MADDQVLDIKAHIMWRLTPQSRSGQVSVQTTVSQQIPMVDLPDSAFRTPSPHGKIPASPTITPDAPSMTDGVLMSDEENRDEVPGRARGRGRPRGSGRCRRADEVLPQTAAEMAETAAAAIVGSRPEHLSRRIREKLSEGQLKKKRNNKNEKPKDDKPKDDKPKDDEPVQKSLKKSDEKGNQPKDDKPKDDMPKSQWEVTVSALSR